MAELGKIFIYEQNAQTLANFASDLEAQGFVTFGTDNIYRFLKYAQTVHPDIIVMNMPANFEADEAFWAEVEQQICTEKCPQIFINTEVPFKNTPALHIKTFPHAELAASDLISLVNESRLLN